MHQVYKLANGLTVLLVPNPVSQAVLVGAFVKVGSRHEEESINGISHFIEHLNFKGTKKYPTARKLSEVIDSVGGEFNAATSKDSTFYYVHTASKHVGLAFDILSDSFLNPAFKPAEIQKEKGVILEEINMYLDLPQRHVIDMLQEAVWSKHPLGRFIGGTPESVKAITRKDILDYKSKFYSPDNTIITVAGKFDNKEVRALIDKYWRGYKNLKAAPTLVPADLAQQKPLIYHNKKTSQAHFALAFKTFDRDDERNFALAIMTAVLSGGSSSRLFTEIREKRGLAYYVRAQADSYQDTGLFMVRAGVETKKIELALVVIVKELAKLKKTLITPTEIKKAKEYWKGRIALALEDTESQLDWYLEQVAFQKSVDEPKDWGKKIDTVTPQQVRALANELFVPSQSTLSVVGPYDKKRMAQLRSFAEAF